MEPEPEPAAGSPGGVDMLGGQPYIASVATHASNDPNEDTHLVMTGRRHVYAAVHDGHGGNHTSQFLRERSFAEFETQLKKSGGSPKAAFEKAWPQLDADYLAHANKQPKKRGLFSGSCACAAYLDCAKNRLFISNLGDSRAVLANVDETGWVETVEMSTDHSAGTFVERHRVKEEHSHDPNVVREEWDEFLEVYVYLVKCAPARHLLPVCVPLAMTSALTRRNICMFTRSIGDAYMKHPDVTELYNPRMDASHKVLPLPKTSRPYIINTPEVRVREVQPGDSFVIVASDGLWDEMSNHEAVTRCADYLRRCAASGAGEPAAVAQHLLDYAMDRAAVRLKRQEPELDIRNRFDLMKIPPGK